MNRDIEDGLRQAETAFMELCAMATDDLEGDWRDISDARHRIVEGTYLMEIAQW